ncbi:MAG: UDP-N-acetylglucosamine 1-carboxyvinyltransferase [Leptolyngbya sp. RL_3_1]|nr:UDP-N-acetylglucosamine 1-carboxyvinyltransferase [Leptolyngbya sp. RL_3_1]
MEDKPIVTSNSVNQPTASPEAEEAVLEIWGQQPLSGHVSISGAKNSALVVLAGTVLSSQPCRLRNIPNLMDIDRMAQVLSALGIKVSRNGSTLDVDPSDISHTRAPYDLVSRLRASFFIIGPLLARMGVARIPCRVVVRSGAPVELHVRGLQAMGADVHIDHGTVHASVPGPRGRLQGAKIHLDYPSVGATETLMMAATLADGETILENAAQEPEVADLANFCRALGARIRGVGTKTMTIAGVPSLHGTDYGIIPDRIEAGTFLAAGVITRSEISLSPIIPEHLSAVVAKLQEMGSQVIAESPNRLRLVPGHDIQATDIQTLPHPGFPTDMQAQFMALLTLANGSSMITETVFENRLRHVAELNRMGANVRLNGNCALVQGVPMLSGAPVQGTDLRAAAALVVAGLGAHGKTTLQGLQHLDRGYERLEHKLIQLGAQIRRTTVNSQDLPDRPDVLESAAAPATPSFLPQG